MLPCNIVPPEESPSCKDTARVSLTRARVNFQFFVAPWSFPGTQMQCWPRVPHQKDMLALGASPEHKALNSSTGPGARQLGSFPFTLYLVFVLERS